MAASTTAVPAPTAADQSSSNTAHATITDLANALIARRTRALRLSQQLRITAEIAYLQARHAEHAPIVHAAERSARTTWDGDTQDIAVDDNGTDGTRGTL